MKAFRFITQSTRTAMYKGPSGFNYTFTLGMPTKVENKEDIAFFKSMPQRFESVGLMERIFNPKEPDKGEDELLLDLLNGVKGITKKTIKILAEIYVFKDAIIDVLDQEYELDPNISAKQQAIVEKTLRGE